MSEHNTQLPTSVELCGKSKWEVRRTRVLRDWEVWKPGTLEAAYFETWREAMDYIDEQARTVEVTLPRLAPQGEATVSATWDYDQQAIHYITPTGRVVQGTTADLKPLALALLALHYQREVAE